METKGQINRYTPYRGTGRAHFTINLANGTTPFLKHFDGVECNSECYRFEVPTQRVRVQYAWYRPTMSEFEFLDRWGQDHVLNGGLLCGELTTAVDRQLPDDPVQADWDYEKFQVWCLETYGKRRGPLESPPK